MESSMVRKSSMVRRAHAARKRCCLILPLVTLALSAAPAQATRVVVRKGPAHAFSTLSGPHLITADANAMDLAAAMQSSDQPGLVVGASWPALPGGAENPSSANAVGVGSTFAGNFMPNDGPSFAAMTTGDVAIADPPNDSPSAGVENGTSSRNVNDPSILKVDVNVPAGNNCLAIDGAFYSEEYPEFVGSQFNDAFIAELDNNSWTYDPTTNLVTAPDNFAFDENHNQLTVNSVSFTAQGSTGLQYDGSTRLLAMSTPVTPGPHSLYFSIYDAGDHIYDSAMFLDHLRTLNTTVAGCEAGAKLADTDGDGIPDIWETNGIRDHNGNMLLNLPAMGADPNHKDIFVQSDSMSGLQLSDKALMRVEKAFEDSPVQNPDGTTGIHLHVDNGPNSVMNLQSGQTWGALSRANNNLPFQTVLGGNDSQGNYGWSAFGQLKAANFDASREPVFHYIISANRQDANSTSSGISRGIPSSDFLVTLGSWCQPEGSCAGPLLTQAGTFMHELGHNLGLHHGGQVDSNRVPNYLSVMNYSFQTTGLLTAPDIVDYSRYDSSTIPSLDETQLNEPTGFEVAPASPAANELTLIHCQGGFFTNPYWAPVPMSGPVDFNCNGSDSDTSVGADLNGDGSSGTLTSYNDWSNLLLKGGAIGGQALGALLPSTTVADEAPMSELQQAADALVPPPTATTGGANAITTASATLNGQANPNGQDAQAYFQYGPTTSYGLKTTPADVGSAKSMGPVSVGLTGLTPNTTYHYQAIVETSAHLVYGSDQVFTTMASPGQPPLAHPPLAHPSSVFTLVRSSVGRRGVVTFVVRTTARGTLSANATYLKPGKLSLTKSHHKQPAPRRLAYGSGTKQGGPGLTTLTLKPTKRALTELKKAKLLQVRVVIAFLATGEQIGTSQTRKLAARFVVPKPQRHHRGKAADVKWSLAASGASLGRALVEMRDIIALVVTRSAVEL
jgi:hypothetical protein